MKTLVGIISYNTLGFTSYQYSKIKDLDHLVIDNGSTDGSASFVSNKTKSHIINTTNLGFTKAFNQILEYSISHNYDYTYVQNTDCLFDYSNLDNLHVLDAGIVGPKILQAIDTQVIDGHHTIQSAGVASIKPVSQYSNVLIEVDDYVIDNKVFAYNSYTTNRIGHEYGNDFNDVELVDSIMFVSCLINNDVIYNIGYLNEDMVNYGSDTEYCLRAIDHGWKVVYNPSVSCHHIQHGSSSGTSPISSWKDLNVLESILVAKNKGVGYNGLDNNGRNP